MTLLELTVVILVLLSLISTLFVGAKAWKRGSDRSGCILQIRGVQVAVRSFANLYGFGANQDVSPLDLKTEVIGSGQFFESAPGCPGNGTYEYGNNKVPKIGNLYINCSLKNDEDHEPAQFEDW